MASVSEFAPPTDKTEALLSYPFRVPEGSFIMNGTDVIEMPENSEDFWHKADKELIQNQLPGMADRIPVIAYGANANPYRYAEKINVFSTPETHDQLHTTPVQDGEVKGSVVWHGKQGQGGAIFAELYDGPLLEEGQTSICKITWLTKEQLSVMHTTEGITYHLAEVPALIGSDKKEITAYAYVAGHSSVLLKDGRPVAVKRPGLDLPGEGMTAKEAVEYILAQLPDDGGAKLPSAKTPEQLVAEMNDQPTLADKKALQAAVEQALRHAGSNQMFTHATPEEARIGRADLNFMNHYITLHLLEEQLTEIRSQGASKDIVEEVRKRAHNELKERLENHT